jgi:hypothetical protein
VLYARERKGEKKIRYRHYLPELARKPHHIHSPDIRVYGLDGHGRNVQQQLAFQKTPADICILVP